MERGGEGRELVVIEIKEKGRGRGVHTVNMTCIWRGERIRMSEGEEEGKRSVYCQDDACLLTG